MYNKKFKKFLKKNQFNSGFTLTELLAGLFMSIFVTGALGFGLYQIMSATAREKAKTDVRNEASRAVEFISDELRRASAIEVDNSLGNLTTTDNPSTPDIDESVAPDFNLPAGGTARLALQIPGVEQRVIYSVAPPLSSSSWQGPLVLYRWGPNLGNDGAYTNQDDPTAWSNAALIDGIDNTNQTVDCGGNSITYQGFFACVVDDDDDAFVENLVDTNSDGRIDDNDGADTNGDNKVNAEDGNDVNGFGETAQIFLTGGIDTDSIAGNDTNYTAQTKAVARAKDVDVNNAQAAAIAPITFRSLEADYICTPDNPSTSNDDTTTWTMRTDFDNNPYDSSQTNNATRWIHEPGRQAQPVNISSDNDLNIYSIPVESNGCLNGASGNEGANKNGNLSNFINSGYTVSHSIKYKKTVSGRSDDPNFWKSFNGNNSDISGYNNPNIEGNNQVLVFKEGSRIGGSSSGNNIPAPLYGGYDFNDDNNPDRMSLGRFLFNKGYAKLTNPSEISQIDPNNPNDYTDPPSGYTIKDFDESNDGKGLKTDERIIAFEVGHTDPTQPGFDVQDNVFIMRHDAFATDYGEDNSN